jgi:hypothetical protein
LYRPPAHLIPDLEGIAKPLNWDVHDFRTWAEHLPGEGGHAYRGYAPQRKASSSSSSTGNGSGLLDIFRAKNLVPTFDR